MTPDAAALDPGRLARTLVAHASHLTVEAFVLDDHDERIRVL